MANNHSKHAIYRNNFEMKKKKYEIQQMEECDDEFRAH